MVTINQLVRNPRKQKKKTIRLKKLEGCPFKAGTLVRIFTTKPRKPNSANRAVAKVRLTTQKIVTASIPGNGHYLPQFSKGLIGGGHSPDLPSVNLKIVRGSGEFRSLENHIRRNRRSKFGQIYDAPQLFFLVKDRYRDSGHEIDYALAYHLKKPRVFMASKEYSTVEWNQVTGKVTSAMLLTFLEIYFPIKWKFYQYYNINEVEKFKISLKLKQTSNISSIFYLFFYKKHLLPSKQKTYEEVYNSSLERFKKREKFFRSRILNKKSLVNEPLPYTYLRASITKHMHLKLKAIAEQKKEDIIKYYKATRFLKRRIGSVLKNLSIERSKYIKLSRKNPNDSKIKGILQGINNKMNYHKKRLYSIKKFNQDTTFLED